MVSEFYIVSLFTVLFINIFKINSVLCAMCIRVLCWYEHSADSNGIECVTYVYYCALLTVESYLTLLFCWYHFKMEISRSLISFPNIRKHFSPYNSNSKLQWPATTMQNYSLTLILLMWRIRWAHNNASK